VIDLLHEAYLSFVQNEGFNYLHGVSIQSNQCPELLVVNIFRFQGHGTNENFTGVKIDTKVEVPYVSAHHETWHNPSLFQSSSFFNSRIVRVYNGKTSFIIVPQQKKCSTAIRFVLSLYTMEQELMVVR
jgi:hypothetical protein